MTLARVLGPESDTWAELFVPGKPAQIEFAYAPPMYLNGVETFDPEIALTPRNYRARLVRELPEEDGGPLLIYRVGAKDVLNTPGE